MKERADTYVSWQDTRCLGRCGEGQDTYISILHKLISDDLKPNGVHLKPSLGLCNLYTLLKEENLRAGNTGICRLWRSAVRRAGKLWNFIRKREAASAVSGLQNLEKIAAVEGIDAIMAGPNDLAADMGIPGETESEEIIEAVGKISLQAEKNGKSSGIITSNLRLIRACRSRGANVFSCNSEVGMLMEGARETIKKYQSL